MVLTSTRLAALCADHTERVGALDPLVPEQGVPDLARALVGSSAGGDAVGAPSVTEAQPGTTASLWSPARTYTLRLRARGTAPQGAVADVLRQWLSTLSAEDDAYAMVTVPSRDSACALPLLDAGFAAVTVAAVRTPDRRPTHHRDARGVTIRSATPDDIGVLAGVALRLLRHDAAYGSAYLRPDAAEILRESVHGYVHGAGRVAVAEHAGRVVGFANAITGQEASWVAPLVARGPAAYIGYAEVEPGSRGAGIGGALLANLDTWLDEAGACVDVLHHAALNPRSTPFWYAHGFRPLWTTWRKAV